MFSQKTPKEKKIKTDNPFLSAREEYFENFGHYIKNAHNWRIFAFFITFVCLLSIATNFYQLSQSKIIPYVIELDKLGTPTPVRALSETGKVPDRLIQSEIANFISNWRSVSADLDLQKRRVGKLAAYTGGAAHGTIQEWFSVNNPYKRAAEQLVSVDFIGVPLPVSKDSWRIAWKETVRNHSGNTIEETNYEATVRVILVPANSEEQLLVNPCGIIITDINFSKF